MDRKDSQHTEISLVSDRANAHSLSPTSLRSKWYKNVFITHTGIALKGIIPILFTFFPHLKAKFFIHFYIYAIYKWLTAKRIKISTGKCVLLHNHWSRGYHHWVSEVIIKIFHLKEPLEELTILIPEESDDFTFQTLQTFPFKKILRIPVDKQIQADNILLVENPTSGHFNPMDMQHIREHFFNYFQIPPKSGKRVYISREEAPVRHIINEAKLIQLLEKFDFIIAKPELLTFEEQVRLFSSCSLLISNHGAGLTNCLFMPPGSQLLELYRNPLSSPSKINRCFQNMAEATQLDHHFYFCEISTSKGKKWNDADIFIEMEKFEKFLSPFLS